MRYLLLPLLLAGCATNHYGRQLPVVPGERAYSCEAIAIEIAKCDAFTGQVKQTWDDTLLRRAGGWLADAGIGDERERRDAMASARNRRSQLLDISIAKHCPPPGPEPRYD